MEHSKEPKWYVLHTFSGYENVAKENLETVVDKFNLQDRIFEIVIPEEDVIEEKNGKKKLVTRKSMPCYLLVKMIYGDDLWHNITRTRGITGFVGPKGRPLALTEDEVIKLRLEKIKVETDLEVGNKVEIVEGPLDKMVGTVVSVDPDAGVLTVTVEMFGRENNVELEFGQVRKID
ncbi:MAG: transcription termination/antitermination factor NusG [Clostridia bacterium]|nr:transcription termination/antitermination factor NusG [Clostridia bacterium]